MSCDRVSLFTKVTTSPTLTVTAFGLTPLDVIVTVAPTGPLPGDGDIVEPPPHAGRQSAPTMIADRMSRTLLIVNSPLDVVTDLKSGCELQMSCLVRPCRRFAVNSAG